MIESNHEFADNKHKPLTAPDLYLNQVFLIIRARGRPGKIPVGEISRPQTATIVVVFK